jgi:AcrR family transcriptional regulator
MPKVARGFAGDVVSRKDRVHRALLDAGRGLFLKYGLRRTSMEAIAEAAHVAKATAYAYFLNKNDVFRAVVEDVVTEMVEASKRAAAAAEPGRGAVEAAIKTKFLKLHELLRDSAQGEALLHASNQLSSEAVRAGHDAYVLVLARLLVEASVTTRARAKALSEMIDAACEGIVLRAASAAIAEERLVLFIDVLFGDRFQRTERPVSAR